MSSNACQRFCGDYRVPGRFTMAEFLGVITLFCLLFGALRIFEAATSFYWLLGGLAAGVCLVQMLFPAIPRGASAIVGALAMPVWVSTLAALESSDLPAGLQGEALQIAISSLPFTLSFGALLGYCTGAVEAGVFLLLDKADGVRRCSRHTMVV